MIDRRTVDVLEPILAGIGIIEKKHLVDAAQSADKMNVPLSRALIMLGFGSENSLKLPLQAKELVIRKEITVDLAIKACRLATQNSMQLQDALSVLEKIHKTTQNMASLAHPYTDSLLATEIISREQFGRAILRSQDSGMNVGRCLVINRDITNTTLNASLYAHILIRDGKISKEHAAKALKLANQRKVFIEQVIFELGIYTERPNGPLRLGELFAMAGYISESDMLDCLELELTTDTQIGQILLNQGFVTPGQLEAGVCLQNLVEHSSLRPFQAAQMLRQLRGNDISVSSIKSELERMNPPIQSQLKIGELLVNAQMVEKNVLDQALVNQQANSIKTGRLLLEQKAITETSLMNTLRCLSLARQGYVSNEQATKLLKYCFDNNTTPDEALQKTGCYFPARMQWIWQ